jgi:hypothetical protein
VPCPAVERSWILAAPSRSGGHHRVTLNGHWQDKAVVVVGVFPDHVDASGRGGHPFRLMAIDAFELLCGVFAKFVQVHTAVENL